MAQLKRVGILVLVVILLTGVLSAAEGVIFQIRFFRGIWAEDQPARSQASVLSTSSRPELALFQIKEGGSDDEVMAAAFESIMEVFKPRSLQSLFKLDKPWDRQASFLNENVFREESSYTFDFYPKILSINNIQLRIIVKSKEIKLLSNRKEALKSFTKNDGTFRQILDVNIILEAGDPILIGVNSEGYGYFLIIREMGIREAMEIERKGWVEQKTRPVPAPVILDSMPTPVYSIKPIYPEEFKRRGVKGEVVVQIGIDPAGNVLGVKIVKSLHSYLDYATVEAVRQWRFAPIIKDNKPVSGIATMIFRFDPESDQAPANEEKGVSPDLAQSTSGPLSEILNKCAGYSRGLANQVVDFVCVETIKETNFRFMTEEEMKKRNLYTLTLERSTGNIISILHPWLDLRSSERNKFVSDLLIIKKTTAIEEQRILIEENGRKLQDRSKYLEEKRFSYLRPLSVLNDILSPNHRPNFIFALLDENKIDGVRVFIVEAIPKPGNVSGIIKARIWIEQKNFRVHKIEIEGIPLEGFERLLDEMSQFNLTPKIIATHSFQVEKKGILLPTRSIIRVFYPLSTTAKRLKQEIEMNYDRYRFYTVESDSRIKLESRGSN